MKYFVLTGAFFFCSYFTCSCQVRDSICVHEFGSNKIQSKGIRKLDSTEFRRYRINSKLFSKKLKQDSLYADVDIWKCASNTVFVGDYISSDSIHYFDYFKNAEIEPLFYLKGFCGPIIYRDQLPLVSTIRIGWEHAGFSFQSCNMYIQRDTGVAHFEIFDVELPRKVKDCIMAMHDGQMIIFDNIKILYKGENRTIQNPPGYVIEN